MCDISDLDISEAYNLITESETIDWLLLGYKNTRDAISLYSFGVGGLSEFRKHLTMDEIFFGFVKLNNRCILITWLPEHFSGIRRARALVHSRSIALHLNLHYAQLTASNINDLSEDNIRTLFKLDRQTCQRSPSTSYLEERAQRFNTSPIQRRSISQDRRKKTEEFHVKSRQSSIRHLAKLEMEKNAPAEKQEKKEEEEKKQTIEEERQKMDEEEKQRIDEEGRQRREKEKKIMEEEGQRREEEERRRIDEEERQRKEEERQRKEEERRRVDEEERQRKEEERQRKEEERQRKEEERQRMEEEIQRREEERKRKEEKERQIMEKEIQRREEERRIREEEEKQRREEERQKIVAKEKEEKAKELEQEMLQREQEVEKAREFEEKEVLRQQELFEAKKRTDMTVSGFISVQPNGTILWKRRFFTMKQKTLSFYKDELSATPLEVLDLNGVALSNNMDMDFQTVVPNSFILETKLNGSYQFAADDKKGLNAILSALQMVASCQ